MSNSEILLTQAAFATLKPDSYRLEACREFLGEADHDFYRFRARLDPDGNELEIYPRTGRAIG